MATLVVVTGNPATGKTTVAKDLGAATSLPVVCKDDIKERLADVLGVGDQSWSKQLGHAASVVLYTVAERMLSAGTSVLLESNFPPELSGPELQGVLARTGADVVQVLVTCPPEIAARRYAERDRHPIHVETDMPELPPLEPMDLPGPLFVIDTTDVEERPPDLAPIVEAIVNNG